MPHAQKRQMPEDAAYPRHPLGLRACYKCYAVKPTGEFEGDLGYVVLELRYTVLAA